MSAPTEAQLIQEQLDKDSRAENAHKTWRYRYRADAKPEGRLFDHPDEVPDGMGWVDSPADCQDRPPADSPPLEVGQIIHGTRPDETLQVVSVVGPLDIEDMPVNEAPMKDLRIRYAEVTGGGKVAVGVSKEAVQVMIRDTLAAARGDSHTDVEIRAAIAAANKETRPDAA